MELPALVVFGYFLSFASDWNNKIVLVSASLWGLHYVHRAIIFPLRIQTKGKKMPLVIMLSAILFNTVNGFLNGYWVAHFANDSGTNNLSYVRIIFGILLFLAGFAVNQYHDGILIRLRKGKKVGYQIPFGGMFKYVSCPNFLGEIISWLGFFVVVLSLPAFAFLVWTLVNLIPRALDHHRWYRNEFPDYPANRKAIFPFIL
jgi:steroid 5-alpha reductase family enzyme